ncbi:hypothetical protein BJX99DRAFT_237365 [Aspergillus californicus]
MPAALVGAGDIEIQVPYPTDRRCRMQARQKSRLCLIIRVFRRLGFQPGPCLTQALVYSLSLALLHLSQQALSPHAGI